MIFSIHGTLIKFLFILLCDFVILLFMFTHFLFQIWFNFYSFVMNDFIALKWWPNNVFRFIAKATFLIFIPFKFV